MPHPETHIRIDEGIKRGPQNKRRPLPIEHHGRPVPIETRNAAITDALASLKLGESTDSIAARYGITGAALRAWLIADDRADKARAELVASKLSAATDGISTANDPLALARARELFRAWGWIGERRLPALYGPKQEIQHSVAPILHIHVGQDVAQQQHAAVLPPIEHVGDPTGDV